ncbi:hypothetical protein LMH73_027765 [Vibrio splendidus]|nr:hypothetical protein [Vibrio splendidus]MCC4882520.1 hypothetical protein [Vibrio splendidus]
MLIEIDKTIEQNGDTWLVLGTGVMRNINGKVETYCHLASTTRFTKQRNGNYPAQVHDWVGGSIYPSDIQFVSVRSTNIYLKLVDSVWLERLASEQEWKQASASNQKKYHRFYDEESNTTSFYKTFSVSELEEEGNELNNR